MKTLTFKSNVHLSPKFGGIEHGEKIGGDIKNGATHEIESDELADHLIERGLAEEVKIEAAPKSEKKKKAEAGAGGGAAAAILLFLGLMFGFAPLAHADLYSYKGQYFTNSVTGPLTNGTSFVVGSNATVTVNSDPIPIAAKRGIGIGQYVLATNNLNVAGVTNNYDIASVVGSVTNWTTTHPLSAVTTATGTNIATTWSNNSSTTLDNAVAIRWAQCINANTNPVTVSGWASWSTYAP